MRLETSGPPIVLFSTYWRSQDSTSALQQRDNIAFKINQVINPQGCIPIILGDMNATFRENDRSSHISYRKDAHYQKFTQNNHLVPIDYNLAKRPWTFSMCNSYALNSHTTTRLDDILLGLGGGEKPRTQKDLAAQFYPRFVQLPGMPKIADK